MKRAFATSTFKFLSRLLILAEVRAAVRLGKTLESDRVHKFILFLLICDIVIVMVELLMKDNEDFPQGTVSATH